MLCVCIFLLLVDLLIVVGKISSAFCRAAPRVWFGKQFYLVLSDLSSFNQGSTSTPNTSSELNQVIARFVADIESAKEYSSSQIALMRHQIDSLIGEKDEALCSLSLLREQQELGLQEKDELLKEKDELLLQGSVLQNEVEMLKREVSLKSAELEQLKSEISHSQQETRLMLLQVRQLQAELERYFLLSQDQSKLLDARARLQSRSTALLLEATT